MNQSVLPYQNVPGSVLNHPLGEETFDELFQNAELSNLETFFGASSGTRDSKELSKKISNFLVELSLPGETRDSLNHFLSNDVTEYDPETSRAAKKLKTEFFDREARVQMAFRLFKERYPTQIWLCCERRCFATIATCPTDVKVFDELDLIHDFAEKFHSAAEKLGCYIDKRRKGVGTSTTAFSSVSRAEREAGTSGESLGNRVRHMRNFVKFILEVLPYLYGNCHSPRGVPPPKKKLCTQAICCLMGVSRSFLYNRHLFANLENVSEEELISVVDIAGLRMRQHRRIGSREGYPAIETLNRFECGCEIPCFSSVPIWSLVTEYNEFAKLSVSLKPRHKENRFLLNRMFCPLTNTTTQICNRALSALYTVSQPLLAEVRRVLNEMCADSSSTDRDILAYGTSRYQYHHGHPMNRYKNWVREKVENSLDMVIRPDPAGPNGGSVCRVYSPEINTQEKLREVIQTSLDKEEGVEIDLSPSCLQRMVNDYLERKKYKRICFTQSDHNACPSCKTMQYAILQYSNEVKHLQRELDLFDSTRDTEAKRRDLEATLKMKTFQEEESVKDMHHHNERDARIRKYIKDLSDYFRDIENKDREEAETQPNLKLMGSKGWNSLPGRACITHQDDMTKVDLPHVVVNASSDITRWRFDVNAHVSAVTNEAIVFSHEQGSGPKNASTIIEEILIHHILRCKGESIKVIVSDNASVGKNWATTVALPQYLVDQGLATIAMVIFLENNHGKWLADMLFGQFQTRRTRSVLLGIDGMLAEFEKINRRGEAVQAFALNPLSSVDFVDVFAKLGYQTKPPSDFGFTKRNIHFATACTPEAKNSLPEKLQCLLGPALPDECGMVRLSREPPGFKSQEHLFYEDRYIDVPAARSSHVNQRGSRVARSPLTECSTVHSADSGLMLTQNSEPSAAPLVIPHDKGFSESGSGVVASRTVGKVGYNGIMFRNSNAFPEMRNTSSPLVRRAWPKGLLEDGQEDTSSLRISGEESFKCAPLNWIVRRPVSRFCSSDMDWKARYPPMNMLNAKYRQGPRVSTPWIPCATYPEPPFPITLGTAAESAMEMLALANTDLRKSAHLLELLHAVYQKMDDRDGVVDPWLQRCVTEPKIEALQRFRNEMKLYVERERGYPTAPKTLRQVFKDDRINIEKVEQLAVSKGLSGSAATKYKTKELAAMFADAEVTPGKLESYRRMVKLDNERFSKELKSFRKKQRQFDTEHGLLPQPTNSRTGTS